MSALPRALTVRWLLEVDVRVAQRAARNHVSADADGEHRAGRAELLIQHGLRDVRVQVAHVQRSHRVAAPRRVHDPCSAVRGPIRSAASLLNRNKTLTRV